MKDLNSRYPALAIVISWIWIGEIPTLLSIIGGIVVLVGVSLSTIFTMKDKEVTEDTTYLEPGK